MTDPTQKELEMVLIGSANILEEMTDPDELKSRDITREEALRDIAILRSHELLPAGTRAELDALREQVTVLQVAYGDLAKISINDAEKIDTTRMATIEEQRDNWKESARFHLKNEEYYRKERDAALERIAFLEAANEAGEANYQTIKALLKEVGDGKLALEAERDAARAAANVAFAMRDTMATENTRLLDALTIVTPALEAAMGMLQEDEAMPFVRTLGYCILLLEEKAAPPDGDVSDPTHGGGLSPLTAYTRVCAAAWESERAWNDAIDAQLLVEFDLPIWCWEATATYDRTFGDGPCTTEQPLCGPDQPLPF